MNFDDKDIRQWKYVREKSVFWGNKNARWFIIECPFCFSEITVNAWSFAGSGKKCSCGALMGSMGTGFKIKENK